MAEVIYHLRRSNPRWDGNRIAAIRDQICGTFEAGRVTDYSNDSGVGHVSDPDDAHVAAAALACGADVLLTSNVADFRRGDDVPYEVLTPDEFFVLVDDSAPHLVMACIEKQIAYWGKKTQEVDLLGMLRRADCPEFAERVATHLRELAHRR